MKALVYRHSVPLYLLSGLLSRLFRRRFFPKASPVSLTTIPFTPRAGWVTLKPLLCGICGSDLNLLRGMESVLLEPYGSFPAVLGHEVVAEVLEAPGDSGFLPGERVAIEPLLPCTVRGLPPCRSCKRGDYHLCEQFTGGDLATGPVLGYNRSVGGGMAELMSVHPGQLFRLPADMPLQTAVLVDSLASALQPALDNLPGADDIVVVCGAGIIGQHLIRCLRCLGFAGRLLVAARHGFQRELALAGGADDVLMSPDRKTLGEALDARFLPTTLGGGNLEGGADVFFDCAGSRRSMQDGLLCLRARGRYVLVATAGQVPKIDISSLWFRNLTMTGTACYAWSRRQHPPVRTYALALEFLARSDYPTEGLLTHVYGLSEWLQAFQTLFDKRTHRSVKVALDPQR